MSDFPPPPPPGEGTPPPPPPFSPGGYPPPPPPGAGAPPPPPAGFGQSEYGYGVPQAGYGQQHRYASFGKRLGAVIVDAIIVSLFFIPAVIYLVTGPKELSACDIDASGNVTIFDEEAVTRGICEGPTGATIAIAVVLGLIALVGGVVYYAKLEGGPSGQTIGKRAVGIRVVDINTGGPIGFGRALGRYLFKSFISGSVCFLGYLWMLWDDKKQTWHDKVTNAVVVDAR